MDDRAAPNFFVVGAPKAGTTALYQCLDQHPAVYMSPIKEPCFFAPEVVERSLRAREIVVADADDLRAYLDGPMREKRTRGFVLEWDQYLKLFKNVGNETAVGESSVSYLASDVAPRAIRARVPRGRIIMMLRDPADRLFSHYVAARAAGVTRATFVPWAAEQVAAESAKPTPVGPVGAGRYAMHLQRYLDCFPRAQVQVQLYDDYALTPDAVVRDVLTFLGVDSNHPLDVRRRHNVTLVPRWPGLHQGPLGSVRRMVRRIVPARIARRVRACYLIPHRTAPTVEERARAIEIYEPDIRMLETLLHRDLSGWLDAGRSPGRSMTSGP